MRAVFFIKRVNEQGETIESRSFVKEDIRNPFAYKRSLERNEAAIAGDGEVVKVGFNARPEDLQPLLDEAAAYRAGREAAEADRMAASGEPYDAV